MTSPFSTTIDFSGSTSTSLVREQSSDLRIGSAGQSRLHQNRTPDVSDWYASGFADGELSAKERSHGSGLFALAVGLLFGTLCGLMYRELIAGLISLLSPLWI